MDASCKIQGSIHSFRLVYNMCPELWVHIIFGGSSTYTVKTPDKMNTIQLVEDFREQITGLKEFRVGDR